QPAAPDRPNVLVLLVDTLRADHLGCYGAGPSPSPNLDRLAERGLVFEQAIAQAPWTIPSVATILTGLHPRSHGVVAWPFSKPAARPENGPTVLPDVLPTLPAPPPPAGIAERVNWSSGPPLNAAEVQHLRNLYDGGIRFWDAELERLLDGLAALGVRDSTIVVVTADHGEEFQEHGKLTHGPDLYDE